MDGGTQVEILLLPTLRVTDNVKSNKNSGTLRRDDAIGEPLFVSAYPDGRVKCFVPFCARESRQGNNQDTAIIDSDRG